MLIIGERTNANGSTAFREAMLGEDWQKCLDIAKGRPATVPALSTGNPSGRIGRWPAERNEPTDAVEQP